MSDKLAEAQKLVQEEEIRKQQACFAEMDVVLKKYGYALDITQPQVVLRKI